MQESAHRQLLGVIGRWKFFSLIYLAVTCLSIPGVGTDVSHQGLVGINVVSIEGYSKKTSLVSVCRMLDGDVEIFQLGVTVGSKKDKGNT